MTDDNASASTSMTVSSLSTVDPEGIELVSDGNDDDDVGSSSSNRRTEQQHDDEVETASGMVTVVAMSEHHHLFDENVAPTAAAVLQHTDDPIAVAVTTTTTSDEPLVTIDLEQQRECQQRDMRQNATGVVEASVAVSSLALKQLSGDDVTMTVNSDVIDGVPIHHQRAVQPMCYIPIFPPRPPAVPEPCHRRCRNALTTLFESFYEAVVWCYQNLCCVVTLLLTLAYWGYFIYGAIKG